MNAFDRTSTQRNDLAGLLGDIERLEAILADLGRDPARRREAYRRAIEALNAEALRDWFAR